VLGQRKAQEPESAVTAEEPEEDPPPSRRHHSETVVRTRSASRPEPAAAKTVRRRPTSLSPEVGEDAEEDASFMSASAPTRLKAKRTPDQMPDPPAKRPKHSFPSQETILRSRSEFVSKLLFGLQFSSAKDAVGQRVELNLLKEVYASVVELTADDLWTDANVDIASIDTFLTRYCEPYSSSLAINFLPTISDAQNGTFFVSIMLWHYYSVRFLTRGVISLQIRLLRPSHLLFLAQRCSRAYRTTKALQNYNWSTLHYTKRMTISQPLSGRLFTLSRARPAMPFGWARILPKRYGSMQRPT
jgi:hypothetical protein